MSKHRKLVIAALVLGLALPVLLSAQGDAPRIPPYYEGDNCLDCYDVCWPIPGMNTCENTRVCLTLAQSGWAGCTYIFGYCQATGYFCTYGGHGAEHVDDKAQASGSESCGKAEREVSELSGIEKRQQDRDLGRQEHLTDASKVAS